ncbi:MAG: hypothetical protein Q8P10_01165 [bacterium]|nr:hypothetical protein [bacterium]
MFLNLKKQSLIKKFIFPLFLVVILFNPVRVIVNNWAAFFSKNYDDKFYNLVSSQYYSSQYVKKKDPIIIPDETLEAFAGGAFLKGVNPILIIHDQPPMGRYLISASILMFRNAKIVNLITIAFSAIGIFLLSKTLIKNIYLSVVPVAVFINEPLTINKLIYTPLLEPIQLPFILFSIYFFIKGATEKNFLKWFLLTSLSLGFVISTRFFILGAILLGSMILFFLIKRKLDKRFFSFVFLLPLALLVLFASYTVTIMHGYSLWQILGIQKYILFYHKTALTNPFSYWDLILFNRWHTWWGTRAIQSDPNWILLWPVSVLFAGMNPIFALVRKISLSNAELIISLWVISYSLMLSMGYSSTRYFLPLLPFLYILSVAFLTRISFLIKNEKNI